MYLYLFFKQKTAYEMRISDWSSDVCSSDLQHRHDAAAQGQGRAAPAQGGPRRPVRDAQGGAAREAGRGAEILSRRLGGGPRLRRARPGGHGGMIGFAEVVARARVSEGELEEWIALAWVRPARRRGTEGAGWMFSDGDH